MCAANPARHRHACRHLMSFICTQVKYRYLPGEERSCPLQALFTRHRTPFPGSISHSGGTFWMSQGSKQQARVLGAQPVKPQPGQMLHSPPSSRSCLSELAPYRNRLKGALLQVRLLPALFPALPYAPLRTHSCTSLMYQPSARPCQIHRDHETTNGALLPAAQGLHFVGGLGRHDNRQKGTADRYRGISQLHCSTGLPSGIQGSQIAADVEERRA